MSKNTSPADWALKVLTVEEKGDAPELDYDEQPTAGSNKLLKSGTIKAALDAKQNTLLFDNQPTAESQNMLKSGIIYSALQNLSAANNGGYTGTDEPIYVVQIDPTESDPELCISYPEYGANHGFTPATKASLNSWEDTFIDDISPCTVKNDANGKPRINYLLSKTNIFKKADGVTNSVLTGADGNVCTAFPKFYWKVSLKFVRWISTTAANLVLEFAFSKGQFEGSAPYAHQFDTGVEDYNFVGCFEGLTVGGKLTSTYSTTATPTVSKTNDAFQSEAAAGGTGYSIVTYNTRNMVNLLFVAVYASLDSQTTIGAGNVNTSAAIAIGSSYRAQAGGGAYGTTSEGAAIRVFWLENWWGNVWEFITGIIKDANNIYHINTVNTRFVVQNVATPTIPAADHVRITSGFSTGNDVFISGFLGHPNAPFLPSATAGASNTYACDKSWYADGLRTVIVGGGWGSGAFCGAFAFHAYNAPSYSNTAVGARLNILGAAQAIA